MKFFYKLRSFINTNYHPLFLGLFLLFIFTLAPLGASANPANARDFPGTAGNYLSITDPTGITVNAAWTLGMWLRPDVLERAIVKIGDATGIARGLIFTIQSTGVLKIRGTTDTTGVTALATDGTWYRVGATKVAAGTSHMRIIINGVQDATANNDPANALTSGDVFTVSRANSGLGLSGVDGGVAWVFWLQGVELSASALNTYLDDPQSLVSAYGPSGSVVANALKIFWPMQCTGSTETDESGVGNNGTYTGTVNLISTGSDLGTPWDPCTDTTAPTVSLTAPADASTVSGASVTVSANASDNVAVAGVQFKHTTNTLIGAEDTSSPYSVTWDSTSVSDGSYTLIAVARDTSNNYATSTSRTVTVDNTAPAFSSVTPTSSSSINNVTSASDIAYTLSETVSSGTVVLTRTSGTADGNSPHTCTLKGTALNIGAHTLDLSDTTNGCTSDVSNLVDGTVYTVTFDATDAGSNTATQVSRTSVTFDTTAPAFSSVSPSNSSTITNVTSSSDISYTLSEAISSGTVVLTRTSGTADGNSPHTCTLKGNALSAGAQTLDLSDTTNSCTSDVSNLADGAIYTITFDGTDAAGNTATQVSRTSVTFDGNAPVRSNGSPSGTLSVGTTSVDLELNTDETATCKYDTSSGTAYASMSNTFTSTNSTSHSETVSSLTAGSYTYYVRCIDAATNANTSDYSISFTIASASTPAATTSSGSSRPPTPTTAPTIVNTPSTPTDVSVSNIITAVKNILSRSNTTPSDSAVVKAPEPEFKGVFSGEDIVPRSKIARFVFSPLPNNLRIVANKFPEIEKTFEDVGVATISDLPKLVGTKITIPDLASFDEVKDVPSEVIFARSSGESIELGTTLTVSDNGQVRQVLNTVIGQEIVLAVRPEGTPRSITGRIILYPEQVFGQEEETSSNLAQVASKLLALVRSTEFSGPIGDRRAIVDNFQYLDRNGDGLYEAKVTLPTAVGRYNIQTVIEEENGRSKQLELVTVIDPMGYVYRKAGGDEARLKDVTVSIYHRNPETGIFSLWNAKDFQQVNPQITDKTGRYSFLVPEGSYYLKAEAEGYGTFMGKEFKVEKGKNVHENIELSRPGVFTRFLNLFKSSK